MTPFKLLSPLLVMIGLLLTACRPSAGPTQVAHASTAPSDAPRPVTVSPAELLESLIATHGSVGFMSWDGKALDDGDADTVLTLLPGGKAQMEETGLGVNRYEGTYTIDADGLISMQFPTFGHPWPMMKLRRDARSLLLLPVNPDQGFVAGNRGDFFIPAGARPFWPFRPLTADEAAANHSAGK